MGGGGSKEGTHHFETPTFHYTILLFVLLKMRRAASTPSLNHSPNTYKKFNEREKVFTEFGQRLKVEKIITGHHPTSQRTTVTAKREVRLVTEPPLLQPPEMSSLVGLWNISKQISIIVDVNCSCGHKDVMPDNFT